MPRRRGRTVPSGRPPCPPARDTSVGERDRPARPPSPPCRAAGVPTPRSRSHHRRVWTAPRPAVDHTTPGSRSHHARQSPHRFVWTPPGVVSSPPGRGVVAPVAWCCRSGDVAVPVLGSVPCQFVIGAPPRDAPNSCALWSTRSASRIATAAGQRSAGSRSSAGDDVSSPTATEPACLLALGLTRLATGELLRGMPASHTALARGLGPPQRSRRPRESGRHYRR